MEGSSRLGGRLLALDDVKLQTGPGRQEQLLWFYGEVIGLKPLAAEPDGSGRVLRFKSERLELCFSVVSISAVDSLACRASFEVPSLSQAARMLTERRHPFVWCRGIVRTDRRLSALDPVGYRVDVRRHWPCGRL